MTYEEPTPILIKKAKVTRYTVGPGETYTKFKVLGVEKIPRTRDNVAAMRARLMKKWPKKEITKQRRFLYEEIGIRGLLDSYSCGCKRKMRLFYRRLARSHLLQSSLREESNAQESLLL
ncbi:hypothetical protein Tco_1390950 [Tanacetum coccineum]